MTEFQPIIWPTAFVEDMFPKYFDKVLETNWQLMSYKAGYMSTRFGQWVVWEMRVWPQLGRLWGRQGVENYKQCARGVWSEYEELYFVLQGKLQTNTKSLLAECLQAVRHDNCHFPPHTCHSLCPIQIANWSHEKCLIYTSFLEHKHDPIIYNYIWNITIHTRMNGYGNSSHDFVYTSFPFFKK